MDKLVDCISHHWRKPAALHGRNEAHASASRVGQSRTARTRPLQQGKARSPDRVAHRSAHLRRTYARFAILDAIPQWVAIAQVEHLVKRRALSLARVWRRGPWADVAAARSAGGANARQVSDEPLCCQGMIDELAATGRWASCIACGGSVVAGSAGMAVNQVEHVTQRERVWRSRSARVAGRAGAEPEQGAEELLALDQQKHGVVHFAHLEMDGGRTEPMYSRELCTVQRQSIALQKRTDCLASDLDPRPLHDESASRSVRSKLARRLHSCVQACGPVPAVRQERLVGANLYRTSNYYYWCRRCALELAHEPVRRVGVTLAQHRGRRRPVCCRRYPLSCQEAKNGQDFPGSAAKRQRCEQPPRCLACCGAVVGAAATTAGGWWGGRRSVLVLGIIR
ncbi:unnamed protein product [Symbiodinium natans]|uniref:Uncharacterized protein n=1 Tax=Symbiodinium natans TaxID=878477 RepID=A0A812IM08_9DINO|nr:unnamed protein product [Symbiodinium natans]